MFSLFAMINPEDFELSNYETKEFGHGREEIRKCSVLTNVNKLVVREEKWKNLASVVMVFSERIIDGKRCQNTRYYITIRFS